MHTFSRASVAIVLAAFGASSATASIISTSGQATLIARPADAQLNALTSNTTAFVWNEAQNVTLASAVDTDASSPGLYTSSLSLVFGSIPAGSVVSSQFIHFDTVGGTSHTADGSITLDGTIVGIIAWNRPGFQHLDASDAAFGLGTLFSPGINKRGVFDAGDGSGGGEDFFTIEPDLHTLTFHLEVTTPFDEIRVLTAIPAPSTVPLLGFACLAGLRRHRRGTTSTERF
jgi:hypothetical protein